MQGQVLAYNNAVYQTALIVSPLVAGAIYTWNHEWVFYSSAILVVLGGLTMAYMCTWKNVKTIGKKMEVSKELPKENAVEVKVEGENAKPDEQEVENQKQDEQKVENQKQDEQKKGEEKKPESKQQAMNTESAAPAPGNNLEVSISI